MDTICLDFDGVLHQFSSPWTKTTEIPDPPVEGAVEWCWKAKEAGFRLVVCTCRAQIPEGQEAVERWLVDNDFPYMTVTAIKPLAKVYIDDRGYTFRGRFPSLTEMGVRKSPLCTVEELYGQPQ